MHPNLSLNGPRERPRWKLRVAVAGAALVAALLMNVYLLDGIVGSLWATVGAAPTEFAAGYSDQSFRRIAEGMTRDQVRGLVGDPLDIRLDYRDGKFLQIDVLSGRILDTNGLTVENLTMEQARRTFGEPRIEGWRYGRSPTTSPYQVRVVDFEGGRVVNIIHGMSW